MCTQQQKRSIRRLRREPVRSWLVAAASAVVLAALWLPEPATAAVDSGTAVGHNCHEFVAFPEVPYKQADNLVPDKYSVTREDKGTDDKGDDTASLFITARRCASLKVGDKMVDNLIDSYIAVPIRGPGSCDRLDPQDCAPGSPAPNESGFTPLDPYLSPIDELIPLETYLVQWVTNSHLRATWLKQGAGLDAGVTVIEDQNLVLNYNPVPCCRVPGAVDPDFTAKVPPPAPSPYTIKAKVTEPGGVPFYAGQNQWWDTGSRTLIIFAEAPVSYFGLQEGGTITSDDPNSPLGRTFGNERTRPTAGPVDPFEFNFYEAGYWTKCVRNGAQHACEAVDDGDLLLP